ncbi:MAG TPA: hypothetical protein VFJ18_05085 [Pararhizobium sp.]|nr:hypothetical protein [Pararhizobium sp.]
MHSKTFGLVATLSLLALVTGCTTSGSGGLFGGKSSPAKIAAAEPQSSAPIVRGTCPKVQLRDGTAYYRTYTKGGAKDKDPSKVVMQASLDNTTRECRLSGNEISMTVAAAGRVLAGPQGGPGSVTMPIRVAVVDSDGKVLYSELTKYKTELPKGTATTQFLFKKDVTIPADKATSAHVFVGFDEGPYNSK